MAKPFREGKGWAIRASIEGEPVYFSGLKSQKAATTAVAAERLARAKRGAPKGLGPHQTTLAQALQDAGLKRLPFMKGAPQEARRINKWLLAVGLNPLEVTKAMRQTDAQGQGSGAHFEVRLGALEPSRRIPKGLHNHRAEQASKTLESDRLRARLARQPVASVTRYEIQELMDTLRKEGLKPATIQLERALLRGFFNFVKSVWQWSEPGENPACMLRLPAVRNERNRIVSVDEQPLLDAAIQECRNNMVGPVVSLLTETAMRSSEPLEQVCWKDVDWSRLILNRHHSSMNLEQVCWKDVDWSNKILRLRDSKTLKRDVPLSPVAVTALEDLRRLTGGQPEEPIVTLTYESLKAAWKRACERAGLKDLHLHDLRHTAATRMALKTGNVFLVKALRKR